MLKKAAVLVAVIFFVCLVFYGIGRIRSLGDTLPIRYDANALATTPSGNIRIASYNIAHGRGSVLEASNWDGSKQEKFARLEAIGAALKKAEIDIAILNEADFAAAWSENLNQAEIIAKAGGFAYWTEQPNYDLLLPGFSLRFGNAILSRHPITIATREKLKPLKSLEALAYGNHDALRVEVNVGNSNIRIWALHLDVRDSGTRVTAANQILNQLDLSIPTILAGDINSSPSTTSETTAYNLFSEFNGLSTFPTIDQAAFTFPTNEPNRTLDWIFYSNHFSLLAGEVPTYNFSDHLPVMVELRLK